LTSCNGRDSTSPDEVAHQRRKYCVLRTIVRCSRKHRNQSCVSTACHAWRIETHGWGLWGGGAKRETKTLAPPKESEDNHSPGDWMRDDDFSWWGKKHSQFDSVSGCGTLGAAWCVPCTLEAGGARSVAPPDLAPRLFPTIHNSILLIACPNPRGQPLRH
jgi:hypothetical protein